MDANDKRMSEKDSNQVQRFAFNDANHTVGVDGFLVGAIGRRVTQTIGTTTVANDTVTYDFYQNTSQLLYTIRVIYTDGTRNELLEAERIA